MPLRREIEQLDRAALRAEAAALLRARRRAPDAARDGRLARRAADQRHVRRVARRRSLGAGWQVLHITGERVRASPTPASPGYAMLAYADRMDLAFAIADLAVSRAGAATVSELAALGIPAVYVPYPVGNGEQRSTRADVGRRRRRRCSSTTREFTPDLGARRARAAARRPRPRRAHGRAQRHPSAIATAPTAWSRSSRRSRAPGLARRVTW